MRPTDGAATAASSEAAEVRSLPQRPVGCGPAPCLRGRSVALLTSFGRSGGVRHCDGTRPVVRVWLQSRLLRTMTLCANDLELCPLRKANRPLPCTSDTPRGLRCQRSAAPPVHQRCQMPCSTPPLLSENQW